MKTLKQALIDDAARKTASIVLVEDDGTRTVYEIDRRHLPWKDGRPPQKLLLSVSKEPPQ